MEQLETNLLNRALLAPGAGAGVGKLIAEKLLSQPNFIDDMTALVSRAIHAKSPRRWDKDTQSWIQDDDMRTQIQTFFGLLAHMEGEPIKRIVHQHLGAGGALDLVGAIHESPALEQAMRHALDKAAFRRRNTKKVEPQKPVETEPETADSSVANQ